MSFPRSQARRTTPPVSQVPTNTAPPSINEATLTVGQSPTWAPGVWSGSPVSITDGLYADGVVIPGGPYESGEYTLQAAEEGALITVGEVADGSAEVFSDPVGPVAALLTLGELSLSDAVWDVGTADSGTINGSTPGSEITASGLPTGFTIDATARTWTWDGTGSASTGSLMLTETLADRVNSP